MVTSGCRGRGNHREVENNERGKQIGDAPDNVDQNQAEGRMKGRELDQSIHLRQLIQPSDHKLQLEIQTRDLFAKEYTTAKK